MLKKENAKYRRKILACTLAVSTITGSIIMTSGGNYASAVTSIEEIKNNQVGVCGVFTDNWGPDSDIPMNDDDGDGIWEAKIEFDVKEEYITDWSCDGEPTKEGSGIQFKIRLNNEWSDCWGNYDGRNGSYNSQYNYGIPASQVKAGNHVSFTAYLDTNRNDPLAIKDGAVDENDAPDYYYLAGGYKDLTVYPGFAGYEWEENDAGGITITQYYGDDKKAVIPSEIIGKPVTSIGGEAFSSCEKLTSIDIPDSVKEIGYGAFSFCTGLTNITIPDSVTSIGDDTFLGCTSLTSITIPGSITSIGGGAFSSCEKLTSIDIPDSVKEIGGGAFSECSGLTSITIPGSVTSIGEYAFADCTGLKNLTIENGVTSIGDYAFCGCSGLTSITIPKSITSIGCSPFSECTGLTSINVDSDNEKYSSDENGVLFNKDKSVLTVYPAGKKGDYIIPDYVTSIGSRAFQSCTALTSIIIPDSVTNIGDAAFLSCKGLTSIDIPDSVTEIKEWTFGNCTSLTKVNIGNGVTYIGAIAFQKCTRLTSIDIPANVTAFGEGPFSECINLTTIRGVTGSAAETYAQENGITFVALDSEIVTDTPTKLIDDESKITVEGLIPYGTALKVNPLTVDKTKDPDVIASYDISLINGENAAIQPYGKIEISIPCDTKDCKVMWVKDDGTKTDMNAEYINGYYVFTTDHLSVYQIVKNTVKSSEVSDDKTEVSNDKPATDKEISSGNNDVSTGTDNPTDNLPQTGETGILFIPMVLVFCASIVIISVFRKRKHQ